MTPDPTWHHDIRTCDGHATVTLSGEIDMANAGDLHNVLQDAVRTAGTVTVDLADVGFIDSTVIGALVTARNTEHQFSVIDPSAQVRRVLQITGVLDTLTDPNQVQT